MIRAVVSDFGGVVTAPLTAAFVRANEELGISGDALGQAMRLLAERRGEPPIFALERGQLTSDEFMAMLGGALGEIVGRPVVLDAWAERLMGSLTLNVPVVEHYRALRGRGIRLALLTNNVREWQPLWRGPLGIDALFELVVDSGFEGVRKPEPEIYARTLARLGLPGEACVFIDDLEVNLPPARAAGMRTVHFRDTAQALAELDALIAAPG